MLIKKILAAESLGMVHPERQSAKPGVRWWRPGPSGRSQRLGPGPRCCALSASGLWLDIPTLQPHLALARSRWFYFQVYCEDAFFWLSCSVSELQKLWIFSPQTLFLLSSHFLVVDLFVPQRLEYGQEKHCPGAVRPAGNLVCLSFQVAPNKESFHGSFRQPFWKKWKKGEGSLSYLRGRCSPLTPCRTSRCGQYLKCAVSVRSKQKQNTTTV